MNKNILVQTYAFEEPAAYSFDKVGIKGKIFPIEDLVKSTEFVLIDTDSGHETVIRENRCDFTYYVLKGEGAFIVEGISYPCKQGNLVVIPAGKSFQYKGKLKLLLNVTPPWQEDQEETL
jgi:mannose-6-phosphate isomerase-like protein (cupin superfamily)